MVEVIANSLEDTLTAGLFILIGKEMTSRSGRITSDDILLLTVQADARRWKSSSATPTPAATLLLRTNPN